MGRRDKRLSRADEDLIERTLMEFDQALAPVFTPILQGAIALREIYLALREAGFTADEAMTYLSKIRPDEDESVRDDG